MNTLITFDEVQEVPQALTSLKYFKENAPQYQIICAGSLLGVALQQGTSFPVGKVQFLDLYPLSFTEYVLQQLKTLLSIEAYYWANVRNTSEIDFFLDVGYAALPLCVKHLRFLANSF